MVAGGVREEDEGEEARIRSEELSSPTDHPGPRIQGWESLIHRKPLIGWPIAGEQFYNSKMMEEEMGVAVLKT
ncbi:hypothetical protein EJ110_NYTH03627 [Nymphaea thermarum]|nr:hypothetical protein EJ110_NYTH03627 [Nymphaea thermarum]